MDIYNNFSTVLIAGAGQLGSRYLQGMVNCKLKLKVYIFDISSDSLNVCKQRWDEVAKDSKHEIFFINKLADAPLEINVCIVSTCANVRFLVMKEVVTASNVKYWILEKVLGQSEKNLEEIAGIANQSLGAWVNTPRRMLPWYKEIKENVMLGGPLKVKVYGGAWGLACNSIHFIDLICWMNNERIKSIDTHRLDSKWIESKRRGNWEIMGSLLVILSNGTEVELFAQNGEVYFEIEIDDGKYKWVVNEETGVATRNDGFKIEGRIPYQSEMSGDLVEKLITTGSIGLTSLSESVDMHKVFISSLKKHWDKTGDFESEELPIT